MVLYQANDMEITAEDRARAAAAVAVRDRSRIEHLRGVVADRSYEREFLKLDPFYYTPTDRQILRRLVWHYRHSLPRGLRPVTNPADPIVAEIEAATALREQETADG